MRPDGEDVERLRSENLKLRKINRVLMDRVERSTDWQGSAFSLFQAAIVLEGRVEERTTQLETALRQLETVNADLSRAKEQAETAQSRLREAVESISEGFALFDAADRLVLWNSNYVDLIKVLGQDVRVGMSFVEIIRTAVAKGAIPDARGREDAWVAGRLAYHENPGRSFIYSLTDGRWVQVNERRTQDGGMVSLYTDITDIKVTEDQRRERELAERSRLLQAMLESLSQGVAVFGHDLTLAVWNQRYIDLHDFPEGLIREGTPYAQVLACNARRGEYGPGDPEELVERRLRTALTHLPRAVELQLSDGRIMEVSSNRMPDGGFVSTYSDITERKAADRRLRESEQRLQAAARELTLANEYLERRVEQRTAELSAANRALEQANLSKTKFLAAAGHDLHQPLNAARLFAAALAEQDGLEGTTRELVGSIDSALEAIDGLLRALFDISKLDAGVMTAEMADFEIGPLLGQLAREFKPQAREAGLGLTVVPCSAAIHTDPRLLARVLRNFLSNAIRYTERGRVLLGCRRRGGELEIAVWDTGIGIPESKLADVFQEFQQVAQPGRQREKGMGLGLAIVERIARLLGHAVLVRSRQGHGSAFAVRVPIARRATSTVAPRREAEVARDSLDGLHVLAIDDDPSGLEAITALLRAWRCTVRPVGSGTELDRCLAQGMDRPDMVVADYHLGDGRNGEMLIAKLRGLFGADLPAFVVTSDRSPDLRARLKAQGLSVLPKPVQPARLRALMSHLSKTLPSPSGPA